MQVENAMVLDRGYGRVDAQEVDSVRLGKCQNKQCTEDIISGYEAYVWDDMYFCSKDCFCDHMWLEEVEW